MVDRNLERCARKLRLQLEQYSRASANNLFALFPSGCCRDASYFLAIIFSNKGVEGLIIVSGTSDKAAINYSTHAWLEIDAYIFDITGDQFNEKLQLHRPPIYISNNHEWYDNEFKEQDRMDGETLGAYLKKWAKDNKRLLRMFYA